MLASLSRSALTRSVVIPLALVSFLSGCHRWVSVESSPREFIDTEEPGKVRVTTSDGEQVEFESPRVEGDSLVVGGSSVGETPRSTMSLDDIAAMEKRAFDVGATVVMSFGILVGAVLAAGLVALAACDNDDPLQICG